MLARITKSLLLMAGLAMSSVLGGEEFEQPRLLPPLAGPASESAGTVAELLEPGEVLQADVSEAPWWQPGAWLSSPIWEIGAELGINGSDGNGQVFSILSAFNGKRETEGNVLEWDLKYGKTQSGGVETQHYALSNSRWDWKFTPIWFLYNKNTFEYDEFKAFDVRLALSGGLGHNFVKNEQTTLTGRMGAGGSREFGGPDDNWVPEANLAGDFEHKLSDRQKVKLTSDYYPAWEDFHDYRLVTNAYWEILLDNQTNLSLKLGAVDRYDSTPNGAKPNDIDYFATLLWKL